MLYWILFVVVIALAAFLRWMGVWGYTFKWEKKEYGPWSLVFVEHVGPYSKIGPAMDKLYKDLIEEGVDTKAMESGFGIYYDDPQKVKEPRAIAGCIVPTLDGLKEKYLTLEMPATDFICAPFTFRNFLSYILGPMKAYPSMSTFLKNSEWSHLEDDDESGCIELYEMGKSPPVIVFGVPVNNREVFARVAPKKKSD